jgi:acetylornithine deacetylase/succinyl-diaminopimelate desuccinylase-like protein
MTRNTRRRVALYGGMVVIVLTVLALPRVIRSRAPRLGLITPEDVEAVIDHEAVPMLTGFVRIDTSNPPGITKAAAAYLADLFACEGIPYEIVGGDPERPIIVARLAGRSREGALLLLNHVDVAPVPDASLWTVPPFAGEMGKKPYGMYLYGRGTLDMKGQAIAGVYAMALLKRAGIVPSRDIVFVGEPGEETFTPEIGIGWLLKNRPDLLGGVTDVFNEGGVNECIAGEIKRFGIEVMQKATIKLAVKSAKEEPLQRFREFLVETDAKQPYRLVGPVAEFMQFIGPSRNDIWGRSMIEPERVLSEVWFRQWAPDVYKSLIRDGLYPGTVEQRDGAWRMELSMTLLPGSTTATNLKLLDRWIAERGLTREIEFITPDSVPTEQEGPAWEALNTALALDPSRAEVGIYVLTTSYTNSAYLRARGFRAYGISPFNVNFQDASKIHNVNERIVLPYYVEGVERMAGVLREFATDQ